MKIIKKGHLEKRDDIVAIFTCEYCETIFECLIGETIRDVKDHIPYNIRHKCPVCNCTCVTNLIRTES